MIAHYWIYFGRLGGHGFIKVGRSNHPGARLDILGKETGGRRIDLIGVLPRFLARDTGPTEAEVHKMLDPYRLAGEWYWPRPAALTVINKLLAMYGEPDIAVEFGKERRRRALTRGAELLAAECA